jgi:NRPS condensation-like uncharacterized protein
MIYAIPLFYRISSIDSHISITRLHRAIQSVIMKHNVLHTALYFDINGTIMQHSLNGNTVSDGDDTKSCELEIINLKNDGNDKTIGEILNHCQPFDLSKGRVIYCLILRHYRLTLEKDDLLMNGDMILFNIHHSAFDGTSTSIFLHDFSLTYKNDCLLPMGENTFQYIDYSIYEHQMDMSRVIFGIHNLKDTISNVNCLYQLIDNVHLKTTDPVLPPSLKSLSMMRCQHPF